MVLKIAVRQYPVAERRSSILAMYVAEPVVVRLRGAVAAAGLVEAAYLTQPVADGVVRVLDAGTPQAGDQA